MFDAEEDAPWPPTFPPLLYGEEAGGHDDPVAVAAAATEGAAESGLVVYGPDAADLRLAVLLAPEVPLGRAVQMGHALMLAVGDSVGALAPPEIGVGYRWPATLLVNGAVAGRVRLAAPPGDPDAVPDWLVAGLELRRMPPPDGIEPGRTPDVTTLFDEGAGVLPTARLIESVSRHFLAWIHRWEEDGFRPLHEAWTVRAEPGMTVEGRRFVGLDEDGRALLSDGDGATRAASLAAIVECFGGGR